ncbi:Cell envelope protein OS=Bosea thiooxidans OX=53254 GN=ARD30_02475 PE=4 SV=1 [Bosea thiooxidans]
MSKRNGQAEPPGPAFSRREFLAGTAALLASGTGTALAQSPAPDDARAIAREATIYGFPMIDNYRIQHSYFVDRGSPEFKAPWNTLVNNARVYTPDDKAIQTPNSDTPYSYVGADLRAEPLVFTVPAVEKGRYYALQFIDMYTFDFAYVGSRATGNGAGSYLLAGPRWQGRKPKGIKSVIRCETDLAFVLYRTQLFDPADIEKVKAIQAGYKVEPLSQFLGRPAPAAAPAIAFAKPLAPEQERNSLEAFGLLNFLLQFCPTHPSERALMARFAKIGIGPGKPFDANALVPEMRAALQQGMADGWKAFAEFKETQLDTGKKTSADGFGTRAFLKNDYMQRMSAAILGIYGNSKDEAIYPAYFLDSGKQKLEGANRYTLRFPPGQLPPVNAFWSLTMYEMPASLLYANALNRYLINSPMLPKLKRDADGGITLYIQNESPGAEREANWLPAPKGPFFAAMRLYWPKPAALTGKWKAPSIARVS